MSYYIDRAVIREVSQSAQQDKAFVVFNVPKHMLIREVPVMESDEKGFWRPVNPPKFKEAPVEGVEWSQDGKKHFIFYTMYNEAKDRLAALDRYINSTFPRDVVLPTRSSVGEDDSRRARPKAESELPQVQLPRDPSKDAPTEAETIKKALEDAAKKREAAAKA